MKDLERWNNWLNNEDQWLRDPAFHRWSLAGYARRFEGDIPQLELAEMHEMLDAAYYWALEELVTFGPQPLHPKDIKIWNAYRRAPKRAVKVG